jgi:hypothetical protein
MVMHKEKIKVLLSKLQRLAESASASEHEASLASQRVAEICTKYGLAMTEAILSPDKANAPTDIDIAAIELGCKKRWPLWYQQLVAGVARGFAVKLYLTEGKLVLIGENSAVNLVEQAIAYFKACMDKEYSALKIQRPWLNKSEHHVGAAVVISDRLQAHARKSGALLQYMAADIARVLDARYGLNDAKLSTRTPKGIAPTKSILTGAESAMNINLDGLGRYCEEE